MTKQLGRLLSRFMAHGPLFFGERQSEWRFDVLSVCVADREILLPPRAQRISEKDFDGLNFCASLLANYHILGNRVRFVKIQLSNAVVSFRATRNLPSEEKSGALELLWLVPTSFIIIIEQTFRISSGEGTDRMAGPD
jgi:hypothetical protein